MTAPLAKTSSPEHSGPATVTGTDPPVRVPPCGPAASTPDPVLLPDQRRPEDVVDAAVEDDDVVPSTGLAVDDAGQVGARRPDEEPAGLEQQPRLARGSGRSAQPVDDRGQAAAEPDEIERLLVRLVRDPEAAARVDEPEPRSRPGRASSPRQADGRGDVRRRAPPASRTFDAPNACRPRSSRCGDATARPRRATRSAGVHPELAGAVVADEPDPLEPGVLGDGGPQQDRLDAAPGLAAIASSRAELAGRLDGDRPDAGRRRPPRSSSSRLPGPVMTIRSGAIPARSAVASSPPDATSAPSPSRPRWATTARAGFALTA